MHIKTRYPCGLVAIFATYLIFSLYVNSLISSPAGYLHHEAEIRLYNFFSNASVLEKIFSTGMNDWGNYSGREFAYAIDYLDYNLMHLSFKYLFVQFYSVITYLCVFVIIIYLYKINAEFFKIESKTFYLLLTLMLSSKAYLYAGPVYRSSKILVCTFLVITIFRVLKLFKANHVQSPYYGHVLFLSCISLLSCLSDPQGLLFQSYVFFIASIFAFHVDRRKLALELLAVFFIFASIYFVYLFFLGPLLIEKYANELVSLKYLLNRRANIYDSIKNGLFNSYYIIKINFGGYYLTSMIFLLYIGWLLRMAKITILIGFVTFVFFLISNSILYSKLPEISWSSVRVWGYYALPFVTLAAIGIQMLFSLINNHAIIRYFNIFAAFLVAANLISLDDSTITMRQGHLMGVLNDYRASNVYRLYYPNPSVDNAVEFRDRYFFRYIENNLIGSGPSSYNPLKYYPY